MKVRIEKACRVCGAHLAAGSFVDLPADIARQLIAIGRAEVAPEMPAEEKARQEEPLAAEPKRRGRRKAG